MKATLKLAGVGLGLVLAQALLVAVLPVQLQPDLVLVFALALGLRASGTRALFLAFGLGLAVDVLSGSPPGMFALLRGTACALTRAFDRALYLRAPAPWAAYVGGYVLLDAVLMWLALRLVVPENALGIWPILSRLPGELVLSVLASGPLLVLFLRLDAATQTGGRRSAGLGLLGSRP